MVAKVDFKKRSEDGGRGLLGKKVYNVIMVANSKSVLCPVCGNSNTSFVKRDFASARSVYKCSDCFYTGILPLPKPYSYIVYILAVLAVTGLLFGVGLTGGIVGIIVFFVAISDIVSVLKIRRLKKTLTGKKS